MTFFTYFHPKIDQSTFLGCLLTFLVEVLRPAGTGQYREYNDIQTVVVGLRVQKFPPLPLIVTQVHAKT